MLWLIFVALWYVNFPKLNYIFQNSHSCVSLIWVGPKNVSCERSERVEVKLQPFSSSYPLTQGDSPDGYEAAAVPLLLCLPLDPPLTFLTPGPGLCVFSSKTNAPRSWGIPTPPRPETTNTYVDFPLSHGLSLCLWVPSCPCSPSLAAYLPYGHVVLVLGVKTTTLQSLLNQPYIRSNSCNK